MDLIFIVFSRDFLVFITDVKGEISFFFLLKRQLTVVYFNSGGFWLIGSYYQLLLLISRMLTLGVNFFFWGGERGLSGENTQKEFGGHSFV